MFPDDLFQVGVGPTSLATLMIDSQTLSFPFHGPVRSGESGQSYALRMAEENGLSGLPALKTWLGKSRFAVLDSADAPLLHRWFGADENQLKYSLGRTSTGRRDAAYVYAGQTLGRSYFLNRSYPRVCPKCLSESGYCLIAWDLSLVVACPKHQLALMDRCDYCQRALSWNRPFIGTCACGMEMGMTEASQPPTLLEAQFAIWAHGRTKRISEDSKFLDAEMVRPQCLTALMTLLWPLSLDGGFHVAYALGTAAGYDDQYQGAKVRPKTPLKKAQMVLAMANGLAEKIARLQAVQFKVSRPSVVVQLLAESASAQVTAADRSLANSILVAVLDYKNRAGWTGVNPHLSQMTLF